MSKSKKGECPTCGRRAHDYRKEEALQCVPPPDVLQFGDYIIDAEYRRALWSKFSFYTTEEVLGSFLGLNPYFPKQEEWLKARLR